MFQIQFNNAEFVCQSCWRREAYLPRRRSSGEREQVLPVNPVEPVDQPQHADAQLINQPELADAQPIDQLEHADVQPIDQLEHADAQPIDDQGRLIVGEQDRNSLIRLPQVSRPPNTSNSCVVLGCTSGTRHRIPKSMKIRLLRDFNYYVPSAARVCEEHLILNDFDILLSAPNVTHDFNEAQIMDMINVLKSMPEEGRVDFENIERMDPHEVYFLTGRNVDQFNRLFDEIPSLHRRSKRPKTALAIYLVKMRTGEPNTRLADMFHISRTTLEKEMKIARMCMTEDFTPQHLGWDHMTREQVLNRNLFIPQTLFGNAENSKCIVILDGTYVYIQKSANFLFQRLTYSHHKFVNLLKPFLLVCCDGYIIEVTGPHSAITSDATILKSLVNEGGVLNWVFQEGDVLILDRGFRDAVPDVEACGYDVHMPMSVERGETQLTTADANKSRLVTICRWVVEVVNGRFKRDFKIFRQEYFNKALPHMQEDFRNAAAITNAFHDPIIDNINAPAFVERIHNRMNHENSLARYVNDHNLNSRRVQFQNMSAESPELEDFPRLSEQELVMFALGTYQIKLARSYYSEHVRNGVYTIQLYRDNVDLNNYNIAGNNSWLLRGKIQSRHTRTRTYYTYILVNSDHNGLEALSNYYCSCKSGRRTVGTCSHVMSIVWFLAWGRLNDIHNPAQFLDSIIINEND